MMNDEPASDTDVSAGLSAVLRLPPALADRVLCELAAGRTIEKEQAEALATAVNGLRQQGVTLPASLEQRLHEISLAAKRVIKQVRGPTGTTVSWTFGRLRGAWQTTDRD